MSIFCFRCPAHWGKELSQVSQASFVLIEFVYSLIYTRLFQIPQGNSQRVCKMLMSRLINLRRLPGQKELKGIGSCQKRQRKRHGENFASMNL